MVEGVCLLCESFFIGNRGFKSHSFCLRGGDRVVIVLGCKPSS